MKELEDKIRTALLEAVDFDLHRGFTISDGSCESISKEIKDIAIEFALYRGIIGGKFHIEDVFSEFIKERYKP